MTFKGKIFKMQKTGNYKIRLIFLLLDSKQTFNMSLIDSGLFISTFYYENLVKIYYSIFL